MQSKREDVEGAELAKKLDYMEHWGVTLLLLYRAVACLAAPL